MLAYPLTLFYYRASFYAENIRYPNNSFIDVPIPLEGSDMGIRLSVVNKMLAKTQ